MKLVDQHEFHYVSRELRDSRHKCEILSHDMKAKEAQIKELQSKLESGEGCKYIIFCILFIAISVKPLILPLCETTYNGVKCVKSWDLGSLGSIVIMGIWPGPCKMWEQRIGALL